MRFLCIDLLMWLIVIYMQTKPTEAGSSFAAVNF